MKYVIVPADVPIVDKRTNEPIKGQDPVDPTKSEPLVMKHSDFVINNICFHADFSKGGAEGLRRKKRVEDKFINCKPGDVVGVEESDFKVGRPLLDKVEWHPQFTRFADQMLPHFEAWEAAEKQDEEWKKKYDAELVTKKNGESVPSRTESPAAAGVPLPGM